MLKTRNLISDIKRTSVLMIFSILRELFIIIKMKNMLIIEFSVHVKYCKLPGSIQSHCRHSWNCLPSSSNKQWYFTSSYWLHSRPLILWVRLMDDFPSESVPYISLHVVPCNASRSYDVRRVILHIVIYLYDNKQVLKLIWHDVVKNSEHYQ